MIRLTRLDEPINLAPIRNAQLARLRTLGREPTSKEIDGYQCVSEDVWRQQYFKCCYCEQKIPEKYNDVEHYRPKAFANRLPGCKLTHGYWWLAFTWENLLFSCPACNRSSKKVMFPLATGSSGARSEAQIFNCEIPLLIDPYSMNPVEHISFVRKTYAGLSTRWYAVARNNSIMGHFTILTCDLNRPELIELRQDHFETCLANPLMELHSVVSNVDPVATRKEFNSLKRLISRRNHFSAFNYSVFQEIAPDAILVPLLGHGWPLPCDL